MCFGGGCCVSGSLLSPGPGFGMFRWRMLCFRVLAESWSWSWCVSADQAQFQGPGVAVCDSQCLSLSRGTKFQTWFWSWCFMVEDFVFQAPGVAVCDSRCLSLSRRTKTALRRRWRSRADSLTELLCLSQVLLRKQQTLCSVPPLPALSCLASFSSLHLPFPLSPLLRLLLFFSLFFFVV